jgi:hypothetical protein
MLVAFAVYASLIQSTNRLVREVNEARPEMNFRWYRWNKAWASHRLLHPDSGVRRSIILRFAVCWILMCAGMICIGLAHIHQYGWPAR